MNQLDRVRLLRGAKGEADVPVGIKPVLLHNGEHTGIEPSRPVRWSVGYFGG